MQKLLQKYNFFRQIATTRNLKIRLRWRFLPHFSHQNAMLFLATVIIVIHEFFTIKERGDWQDPMFFAMSAYIYRIDEGLQFCIKDIQDFAYSGFGGRGGKHGDIFWDNESYAIKKYLKMFSELASATLKQVADWFVWLASTLGRFNANELRRADHEVRDIADGRYDGRIQKFQ